METAPAIDADALRAVREQAGISQNDLARRAGMASGTRVSRWERGEARPRSPQILHAIAAALKVDAISLLVPPEDGPDLRWLRFAAGLTVGQLADATHAAISTVKRWEANGLLAPSETTVNALATALQATPADVRRALSRTTLLQLPAVK